MANTALTPVQFHGASLFVTTINGVAYVAIKPICEAIGLDWQAQHARLKRHPVLAQGISVTKIPSLGGDQQTTLLPLNKLNGWLFGVSVRRVKPELRERLTQYQAECFDVLAQHFGVKQGVSPIAAQESPPISIDTLIALITGGLIDKQALLQIGDAAGMMMYMDACQQESGWGEAVAKQIDATTSTQDLQTILRAASLETWHRARGANKPTRPVPQRAQFATAQA